MPRLPPLVACHPICFGPFGARRAIDSLRELGLGALELPIRTAGFGSRFDDEPLLTDESTPADVAALLRLLGEQGLAIACCPCHAGTLLDPAERDRVGRKMRLAAQLGVPVVTLDAGSAADDAEFKELCGILRQLGDLARELGQTACVEIARGVAHNHRHLRHLLLEVDHPQVRASFDPGLLHLLNAEIHSEVALAKICHLVRHVRLRDSTGRAGVREFPVLGTGGAVDFLRIYQIMRDCGFHGPFSIALEDPVAQSERTLPEYLSRVGESLKYLRRIGFFDPYPV